MAELADIIAGQAERRQAQLERPASMLRQWEKDKMQERVTESSLKTAAQQRKLAGEAGERVSEEAEYRKSQRPVVEEGIKTKMESDKIRVRTQRTEFAQKYTAPRVEQLIALNKAYLETGSEEAKRGRDQYLDAFASDETLRATVSYLPQFAELAGLTTDDLYDPNMSPEEKEASIQANLSGLETRDQMYKTIQKEKANRAAAQARLVAEAQAEGKASGEVKGQARAIRELTEEGTPIPTEEDELSEGQQARVQKTYANFMTNKVFPEMGQNAGKAWFKKNLDKDGKFHSAISEMPKAMFDAESPNFTRVLQNLTGNAFAGKSNKEKDAAIDAVLKSGTFDPTSPFYLKLEQLKDVKISNLRDTSAFKNITVLPSN
jgi:hypothetical protein